MPSRGFPNRSEEDEKASFSDYEFFPYRDIVDENLKISVARGENGSSQRVDVSKDLPLGDVMNALLSMSAKGEIAIRVNPKSNAETIIRKVSDRRDGGRGYFAVMQYNGETYKLKNEPYTWKSGPIAALSKQDTRVVFERSGSLFGKWRSRPTDHVGFKEPFLGNFGLSMASQVEMECRNLLNSRVALRKMTNILLTDIGSKPYIDPKEMALADCIRCGAFNKAPHPSLSSYSDKKTDGSDIEGLTFDSDGKNFSIRADEDSKTLVFFKMEYTSRRPEWSLASSKELNDHKIYDKAIKLFGIDEAAYQNFSEQRHRDSEIPYEKTPKPSSFARSGNFLSSKKLAGLFKLPKEEAAKNAFIIAAYDEDLTSEQAAEIIFNRRNPGISHEKIKSFEDRFFGKLENAGFHEGANFKEEDIKNFFNKGNVKFSHREVKKAEEALQGKYAKKQSVQSI